MLSRLFCTAAIAGFVLAPAAANAGAIALASLDSGQVTVTFSNDVSDASGELFSTASASFGPAGPGTADNAPIPGAADAAPAVDGPMNADSFISVQPGDISFTTDAAGSASAIGDFGSALGEITGSYEFFNPTAGLVITLVMELTRSFDLSTDIAGDLASGATGLSLAILNQAVFTPTLTLSNPGCDPNAAFSVSDGVDFANVCTTTATYTFAPLDEGDYILTFAGNSSVDVVSAIPAPGALGIFGLGVLGLAFARRVRRAAF